MTIKVQIKFIETFVPTIKRFMKIWIEVSQNVAIRHQLEEAAGISIYLSVKTETSNIFIKRDGFSH
jgi:hypothetical protein